MTIAILEEELESHKDASACAQGAIELLAFRCLKRYLTVTKVNKVRIDHDKIVEAGK